MMAAGVREIPGSKTNWLIAGMNWLAGAGANEDDPWCGSAVHFSHFIAGYESPANPAGARNWLKAGEPIAINDAQDGDVVVLWREKPAGWKGHVGYFHSWGPGRRTVNLLGGNQSDGFTVAPFDYGRILGVRRPVLNFNPHTYAAGLKVPGGAVRVTET
jgi:uncharacterized protein (TIGR02594 family)